jgi:glutamate 5-kinase
LLSIGVTSVDGDFVKGDAVIMCSPDGVELARGLTNYSSDEIRRIAGRSSEEFADLLGHRPYDEVVHRDNLAILRADRGD